MEIIFYLCNGIYEFIKCWITFLTLKEVNKSKSNGRTTCLIEIIVSLLISLLVLGNIKEDNLISNTMILLEVFFLSITANCIFYGKWGDFLYDIFVLWIGLTISDFFIQASFCYLTNSVLLLAFNYYRAIYLLLFSLLIFVIRKLLIKSFKLLHQVQNNIFLKLTIFFLLVVSEIYFQRVYLFMVTKQYMDYMGVFAGLIMLFGCVMILCFQKMKYDEKNNVLRIKLNLLENNYRETVSMYQEKARLVHDEKHHLNLISGLLSKGETGQAEQYIIQLTDQLNSIGNRIWTGNEMMDLIMNMKKEICEKNNICITYIVDLLNGLIMDDGDICILFSNMFDNAIEANCKISCLENRWIRFKCIKQGVVLFILMENACNFQENEKKNKLTTTKKEKNMHGFGLESIRSIVDKYDGQMEINLENNIFSISIYLNTLKTDKNNENDK